MKEWAQRARKWHRRFAIPMFILVPVAVGLKLEGAGGRIPGQGGGKEKAHGEQDGAKKTGNPGWDAGNCGKWDHDR